MSDVNQPQAKSSRFARLIKQQLKLGFSTFTVATVGVLSVTFWINFSIIALFIFLIGIAAGSASDPESGPSRIYSTTYGDSTANHKILSIPVRGPIEGDKSSGDYGSIFADPFVSYGYELKAELIEAANSGEYAAVILEIDSPGGTIYGSKAIADGVTYFKNITKAPVYASVQGLSASGAYWSAASADKIIADEGTGIGSIGVIYGPFTYYDTPIALDGGLLGGGVITQNGIEQTYFTAGEGKDAGNPFRRLTSKEQSVIQTSVNDSYQTFIDYVAIQRSISKKDIINKIGAHFYGNEQALRLNLVDEIGSKERAYYQLAETAGVENDFQIVSSHEQSDELLNIFGANLPFPNFASQSGATKSNKQQALACSGSVSVPLAFYGKPNRACTNS